MPDLKESRALFNVILIQGICLKESDLPAFMDIKDSNFIDLFPRVLVFQMVPLEKLNYCLCLN